MKNTTTNEDLQNPVHARKEIMCMLHIDWVMQLHVCMCSSMEIEGLGHGIFKFIAATDFQKNALEGIF